jgi:hypothetical protein
VFHIDVAKVDRDVAYATSVSEACCKAFVQSVSSVSDVCCKRFDLDVAYVSHICCKSMF